MIPSAASMRPAEITVVRTEREKTSPLEWACCALIGAFALLVVAGAFAVVQGTAAPEPHHVVRGEP